MKKLLSMLILICVLMSACFVGAMPASAAKINYDDFDIYDGILVEYIGDGGDVVVPSEDADGNPITEIDSRAFRGNDDITSVIISEGITKMGYEVFENCTYLESVTLPFSLEECGYSTFRNCRMLESITIPSNLKSVPQDFCSGCVSLKEVVISYGVETIGVLAFCSMESLERIVFSETVKEIYGDALSNSMSEKTEVVICNPMCELGYMNGYEGNKGYKSPFASPIHKVTTWTFIVPEESAVAKDLEKFNIKSSKIREAAQSYFDDLEENQKDYGVQSPDEVQIDNDPDIEKNEGGNNAGANTNNGSLDLTQLLLIFGIAFGGLILLIIIIVVVVVIVNSNKKKKKAAAKAARRAAKKAAMKAEAASVEEAPVEEAPVDEVPADDAE